MELTVEEVLVTARLREENLQEVPISAHVIADQLGQQNLNTLGDLSLLVPGLSIQPAGRSSVLSIRGTASGNNASFNQSVVLFKDGVPHGRSRDSGGLLFDLDRVEVLKGPQSIYFGNNAIAGAVSLITNQPGEKRDLSARALYGEDGRYAFDSAASFRFSDAFAIRVAAIAAGQDGYLQNVVDNSDQPNEDNQAGRVTLLFQPSEALDITAKLEGGKNEQVGGLAQQLISCPPPAPFVSGNFCNVALSLGVPQGLDDNRNAFEPNQSSELDTLEGVITANYRTDSGLTITSITGYNEYDYSLNVAANPTPTPLLTASVPERFKQISQQIRVGSDRSKFFSYQAGLFYNDAEVNGVQDTNYFFLTQTVQNTPALAAIAAFTPIGQEINFRLPEKTYSVFGAVAFRATDALIVDLGLRGTSVEKSVNQNIFYGTATQTYGGIVALPANLQSVAVGLGLGTPGTQSASRTDDALMPSAQIQYSLTPKIMSYASYARGFKAGGFNAVDTTGVAANLPYDEEYVNAYEVGIKTKWNEDTLLLNLSAFYSEYTDLQVTANSFGANGAVISLVQNAASSISQGVEFEARWLITPDLRLAIEATYLDAYYDSYPNGAATQLQQLAGIRIQDLSGKPTPLAPDWAGSVIGAYTLRLAGEWKLTTEVTGFFSSKYFLSGAGANDDVLSQDSYSRLDARLALSPNDRWVVSIIGKNLTDENILVSGSPLPTSLGAAIVHKQDPRNFAVQVEYDF